MFIQIIIYSVLSSLKNCYILLIHRVISHKSKFESVKIHCNADCGRKNY